MGRPPANSLPSGAEWQATQSPARARYSPLLSVSVVGSVTTAPGTTGRYPGMKYAIAPAMAATTTAAATTTFLVPFLIGRLHLAAARQRHSLKVGLRGRCVGRRVLRGEPGGDGM